MSDAYPIKGLIKSAEKFHCIRNEDKYARYRSWEHCNKVFNEKHEKRKNGSELSEDEYDYLALHLSFYLASWGMYRGSSMLILTDYKVHIPIVEEIMKENEEVKKANSVLHIMSEDEELQRLAELREKWDLDERSAIQNAKDDGIEEGEKRGKQKEKIEIAKKLKEMNMKIEDISKATGLTKEEIEKL